MDDPNINKKFAVAKGPVNMRTAPTVPAKPVQAAPVALARVQLAIAKQRLGTSLEERLSADRSRSASKPKLGIGGFSAMAGAAVGAVGLMFGLIQGSILMAGLGALGLGGLGALACSGLRRLQKIGGNPGVDAGSFIDEKDIAKLDADMEKVAGDSAQETVDRLADMKERIARCAQLVAGSHDPQAGGMAMANDDQLFIRECVRRYLPDSLASYLKVPQKDRGTLVIDDGKTALRLLHEQIDMLKNQLEAKETRLAQGAGESLMRQQRFLSAKTKT